MKLLHIMLILHFYKLIYWVLKITHIKMIFSYKKYINKRCLKPLLFKGH
jgi:hypothetical protein